MSKTHRIIRYATPSVLLVVVFWFTVARPAPLQPALADPLPSWNEGSVKKAIIGTLEKASAAR